MRRLLASLLAAGVLAAPVAAQPPAAAGDETDTVRKVNAAIDRGVQYLRSVHSRDRQWEGLWLNALAGMDGGVTALATLALLNCGVEPADRDVASGLAYLRGLPPTATYPVGLQTMVFAEARQPKDKLLIDRNVDWLLKAAVRRNGRIAGWSYTADAPGGAHDGSNTQYALLGLYAAKQAGAKIDDKVWKELEQLYRDGLTPDASPPNSGYWRYVPGDAPSFTMTVAGVCGLLIAGMGLDESQQGLDPATGVAARCGRYATSEPVSRGLNWIGNKFAFVGAPGSKSTFYNIYGIERVGRLSGLRFLGNKDWYREGCRELVDSQKPNGCWSRSDGADSIDATNAISTSFALLFLSKGRTPVMVSKLAWGEFQSPERGVLVEKGPDRAVVGWNRKHNDARHLTDFCSRELFGDRPMGWQVYDARRRDFPTKEAIAAEVGGLVQSPVLYLTGHEAPRLTGQQREILKKYVDEGGFVLAEACCGSPEFAAGFRTLMAELFETPLVPLPPEHPVWRAHFAVPPTAFPKLEHMSRGCRTVCLFSPEPLAGYWEEAKYMPPPAGDKGKPDPGRGGLAFKLGANVVAYATGKEPPKQRLTTTKIATATEKDLNPPRGTIQPVQLKLEGDPAPAPGAMRNLMAHLRDAARLDVSIQTQALAAKDADLFKFKFLYMHGRKRFGFDAEAADNLRTNLQSGGLLLADACCGSPAFDTAFREAMAKLFPEQKLQPIPADDELFKAELTGTPLTSVRRRDKASEAGAADDGFRDVPPALEGIKIDGRWVVIYSRYDLGCALEGHKSSDCLGHTRDSALQIATAAVLYALKK
jgi:hypothetical protein